MLIKLLKKIILNLIDSKFFRVRQLILSSRMNSMNSMWSWRKKGKIWLVNGRFLIVYSKLLKKRRITWRRKMLNLRYASRLLKMLNRRKR